MSIPIELVEIIVSYVDDHATIKSLYFVSSQCRQWVRKYNIKKYFCMDEFPVMSMLIYDMLGPVFENDGIPLKLKSGIVVDFGVVMKDIILFFLDDVFDAGQYLYLRAVVEEYFESYPIVSFRAFCFMFVYVKVIKMSQYDEEVFVAQSALFRRKLGILKPINFYVNDKNYSVAKIFDISSETWTSMEGENPEFGKIFKITSSFFNELMTYLKFEIKFVRERYQELSQELFSFSLMRMLPGNELMKGAFMNMSNIIGDSDVVTCVNVQSAVKLDIILSNGGCPNVIFQDSDETKSVLMKCIELDDIKKIEILIDYDVLLDVIVQSKGRELSACLTAINHYNFDVFFVLIENGANIYLKLEGKSYFYFIDQLLSSTNLQSEQISSLIRIAEYLISKNYSHIEDEDIYEHLDPLL